MEKQIGQLDNNRLTNHQQKTRILSVACCVLASTLSCLSSSFPSLFSRRCGQASRRPLADRFSANPGTPWSGSDSADCIDRKASLLSCMEYSILEDGNE